MTHRRFRSKLHLESLETRTLLTAAVALTTSNELLFFDTDAPGTVSAPLGITGLMAGEQVLSIDYRPSNGLLYAVSSANRVLTLNTDTGAATQVGMPFTTMLVGNKFGIDFNPVPDLIRLVSDAQQNLRINPNTGQVAGVDGTLAYSHADPLAFVDPAVVGAGYINNFPSPPETLLFVIDANVSVLALQAPPNNGTLNTVRFLGIPTSLLVGFDVFSNDVENAGYAIFTVGGVPQLYKLHLYGDPATPLGAVGTASQILDLALPLFSGGAGPSGGAPGLAPDVIAGLTLADTSSAIVIDPAVGQLAPGGAPLRTTPALELRFAPSPVEEAAPVATPAEVEDLFAQGFTLEESLLG